MADFDIEELHTPSREWKGWIRNRMTHELEWCIVTAGLMGVFRDPEANRARIVLNLNDFDVKPLCEGAKRGSHVFTYVDDCYSIKFVSKRNARMIYTFGTETEDDFRTWHRALTGSEVEESGFDLTLDASSSSTSVEVKGKHAGARRIDSGLGEDICTSPSPDAQGRNSRVRQFEAIQEIEVTSSSLRSSGQTGNVTPDSTSGKSESSDSLSDSGQSNTTTPDSELADEVPRLRANAHKLRGPRSDQSRFSAPVGDFSLWEEKMGEDEILKKTYSLPMKSPHRVRVSSDGEEEEDAFQYEPSLERSIPNQQTTRSATTTPTYRRPGPVTSFSDPARKKLGSRMTVKASKLVGRMTQLRSQRHKTPLAQSSIITITVEGDLLRKHKSTLVPCFCILSGNVMYCYKSKESEDVSDLTIDIHKYRLSKLTAARTESKELDCAFVLTPHSSGSKEYVFIAKDLNLARKWYGHLEDILKELESRQIRAMQSSAPDLRGSLPLLNQTVKYDVSQQSRYTKSKTRGSTFKLLAMAEEEQRNSIAARMSRGSFEDGYGFTEELSRHRASMGDIIGTDHVDSQAFDDDDGEAFIEITMEDVMRSKSNLGDRAVSRSMDDIGMTSVNRNPLMTGKTSPLGLSRATPKTKRHKRTVPIPASEVGDRIKTGYLEVKKSGSWKRCWSLLTEDRLYIYRKPTDSHTLDMLMLEEYDVEIVVSPSGSSSKTGSKFAFQMYHPRVTGTQLLCESREERTEWMDAIGQRCKKFNRADMEGTSDHRGNRERLTPLMTRLNSDPSDKRTHLGVDSKGSASSSDLSDGSPIMERKKQYIEDKYERVKEAQEMEMLRMNTILNQRRMSADVKIDAVEKKLLQQRKQRKRKKNSRGDSLDEEGELLEDQLEQLKTRFGEINKESQETNLKQEERLKAIENKKDVEFKILEQERKLQKHKKAAQQALQQIVKGISSITPPAVGGGRPRFDLISEEAEDETEERKLSVASSVGISSSDSMGSLCDPRKFVDSEVVVPVMSSASKALAPMARRHAVHNPPRLISAESSTDSSSSMDSPDVARHEFNLVDEFTKSFPVFEGTLEQGSRDKSKSFDSGIADEVDINSNKSSTTTTMIQTNVNGNVNDNEMSNQNVPSGKHIRTEISEDVLRDIEEFEIMARRALEEASWMV